MHNWEAGPDNSEMMVDMVISFVIDDFLVFEIDYKFAFFISQNVFDHIE